VPDDLAATAQLIHDLLRMAPTTSPSSRALHAKGVVASGTFRASGALDGLTVADHLVDGTTPVLVRFSHPGGDPQVSDAIPSGRGLAVKLQTAAGAHDLVAVSSPAFLVRDGDAFVELILARAPDPETGAPDPARIGAFLEAHPEALPAIQAALAATVPASYATIAYNSLHTFFLVDAEDRRRPIRYTWVPVAGVHAVDDPTSVSPDHLLHELTRRLSEGPASFDLVVHLGTAEDPVDDPTAIWPERPTLVAGRLDITAIAPDAEPVIFDPTNVLPGVEIPAGDEILALRRLVYGLSYSQRTS
jgi:catalase